MLTAGSLRPFGLDPDQSRDLLADLADPARWPALFAESPLVGSEQDEGLARAGRCGSGTGGSTSPATTITSMGWPAICAPWVNAPNGRR